MRDRLRAWFDRKGWGRTIIGVPYLWLLVFFLLPFLIVVAMSVATRAMTAPPFAFAADFPFVTLANYARLFEDSLYVRAFLVSLGNAALATLFCLLLGYPMALGLTRVGRAWRTTLLMLIILPFWTSFLLRVYAWMGLMGSQSWFNRLLTDAWNFLVPRRLGAALDAADVHELRGDPRLRLHLPALHGAAALHQPRAPRPDARRGRDRPRLAPVEGVPRHHPAALRARHHRRRPPRLHPGLGRADHPDAGRRRLRPDDRPGHQRRVLPGPRLADGLRRLGGAADPPRRPDDALQPLREPRCGGGPGRHDRSVGRSAQP